jgi:hypothetical protein
MFITKTRDILDLNKFQDEVKVIQPKISFVMLLGEDQLRLTLTEALTELEDTALDAFVASFIDSDPEDKIPLIVDLVHPHARAKHFWGMQYTGSTDLIVPLHPKRVTVKGEVTQVTWYRDAVFNGASVDLTTPVLRADIAYTRTAAGFALWRVVNRTWFNRDGSENTEVKTTQKFYIINPNETMDEGTKRRRNLVQSVQAPVIEMMKQVLMPLGYDEASVLTHGSRFLDEYEDEFSKFVSNSSKVTDPASPDYLLKSVVVKLRDEDDIGHIEWLDKAPALLGGQTTIRNFLINEFSI